MPLWAKGHLLPTSACSFSQAPHTAKATPTFGTTNRHGWYHQPPQLAAPTMALGNNMIINYLKQQKHFLPFFLAKHEKGGKRCKHSSRLSDLQGYCLFI